MIRRFWQRLRSIDVNRSVALGAVAISVCALYVSIQEMRLSRQQLHMEFYPHLGIRQLYDGEGFAFTITNSGPGPAVVNSVQLTDGARYFSDWPEVIGAYLPDSLAFGYERIRSNSINGEVITPGEEVTLFAVDWSPETRKLPDYFQTLELRVCYASLLDNHWLLVNGRRSALGRPCERNGDLEFD